jgi:dipeptidyl aminopeptidase/acylaminoacyl peptidase
METAVSFVSDGLKLAGVLNTPDNRPAKPGAGFVVLHGFAGSKDESHAAVQARMLSDWGYVTLRFDMRGLGDSEGERGHIYCHDQVADTKNALNWLAARPEVDPQRIGVIGHSFGAAVAVYTAGVDRRFAACISSCGWGNGERKFRGQHAGPEAWAKFTAMLESGRAHRRQTGEPLIVSRWDIVPVPEALRKNLPPKGLTQLPVDTAQSMYDFRAEDVVGAIAPRPLLLLHGTDDTVTPTEQSLAMFDKAGKPTDLILLSGVDHFPLAGDDRRAVHMIKDWLDLRFPVCAPGD